MISFELLPTIDIMIDLYEQPRTFERFQAYLKMLQGDTKGDLAMPISGFNPMAKEHLLVRLKALKTIKAEQIISTLLDDLNSNNFSKNSNRTFKVAINLSDDLKGAWTNRYTSDYDSKFKMNGLFTRNFCTPIFWTSELLTEEIIKKRVLEYVFRTIYWLQFPKPLTLNAHFNQELFVANQTKSKSQFQETDLKNLQQFLKANKNTENYDTIFNFFYGDKASSTLGLPTYGVVGDITGFDYAKTFTQTGR